MIKLFLKRASLTAIIVTWVSFGLLSTIYLAAAFIAWELPFITLEGALAVFRACAVLGATLGLIVAGAFYNEE